MTKKRILVVEDEVIIAKNLQEMLGALGYEVPALCYSGEDAIEVVAKINPDLVLMDIVLKGEMDGIQAAGHIQRQFDIPVIYLTVHTEEDTLQRAKITEPFGYVLKPFSDRELYTNIEIALYKHGVEKALRQAHDELEIIVQEQTKELVKANRELMDEILERRRAEGAQREIEERYRGLFDGVSIGLYRTTPEGQILEANLALVELLGYPDRESLLAANVSDFYENSDDRLRWQALVEQKDIIKGIEVRFRRRDGVVFWTYDTGRAIRDTDGQVLYYEGSLEDITERVLAEEERERLFDQVSTGREQLKTLSHRLVEVQEIERRNIARELHDEIGQALTGLKLLLDSLTDQPEITPDRLQKAQMLVDELMNHVHDLSLDLRPSMLDDLGLLPTLMWHFQRFSALTGVQVNFEHAGLDLRFPPTMETATYRIVQEALTNVARHAGVDEAAVRVWADTDSLHLQVEDQGIGFEYATVVDSGSASGLLGMRERAFLLGGQLEIAATPANGTTVTATLPITDRLERRGSER